MLDASLATIPGSREEKHLMIKICVLILADCSVFVSLGTLLGRMMG